MYLEYFTLWYYKFLHYGTINITWVANKGNFYEPYFNVIFLQIMATLLEALSR